MKECIEHRYNFLLTLLYKVLIVCMKLAASVNGHKKHFGCLFLRGHNQGCNSPKQDRT